MSNRSSILLIIAIILIIINTGCENKREELGTIFPSQESHGTKIIIPVSTGIYGLTTTAATEITETLLSTIAKTTPIKEVSKKQLSLVQIQMTDKYNGWGRTAMTSEGLQSIVITRDGGETWIDVSPQKTYNNYIDILAIDKNQAWIYVPSYNEDGLVFDIWKTRDAGMNWQKTENSMILKDRNLYGHDLFPYVFQFSDSQHGWAELYLVSASMAQGYTVILTTDNSGNNWHHMTTAKFNMPFCKGHIYLDSFNQGWWIKNSICMYGHVNDRLYRDPKYTGFVKTFTESDSISHFLIYPGINIQKSYDGGSTWQNKPIAPPNDLVQELNNSSIQGKMAYDVVGLDNYGFTSMGFYVIYSVQDEPFRNYFYITFDGGNNWSIIPIKEDIFKSIEGADNFWADYVVGFYFINRSIGWKRTYQENGTTSIEQTNDGGITWQIIAEGLKWHGDIYFVDENNGWVMTIEGKWMKTINGGKYWTEINPKIE